ncbi:DEAD/DEAH box helicase [Noviherbaspirillum massiliense]|uniref:DEAD/DEAH box helicase n=1 Tax=Noviherbaspirillum massiliense TaxID=1465823 RepID=UPI0002F42F9F|nr:DEAD/DEAH box helicase [Noviherbaspirillum massiliense]
MTQTAFPDWNKVETELLGERAQRVVQQRAFANGLCSGRRNMVVAAPTNSGKSLVGLIGLLQAVHRGKRAILLEPLRALAREKGEEIERLAADLKKSLGWTFNVKVTTGDYRLDDESYADPAPGGELIIATPERLEAILRNPDHASWLDTIGAVCVDEAHLISNPRRGPTLEYLITSFLALPAPPRLFLLSATLGNVEAAKSWLEPCDVVQVSERYPPLTKQVVEVGAGETADDAVTRWLRAVLQEQQHQALVFVYQTASTEKLARQLTASLGESAGIAGAMVYHGKMSVAQRDLSRQAFLNRTCRVVVTTSALAMGVNLPATHVVVRDLTYPNADSPEVGDLLQMMGRAGRGDQSGTAIAICKPSDGWAVCELQRMLDEERLPEFRSAFAICAEQGGDLPAGTTQVLSLLSRKSDAGASRSDIEAFFLRSFGGQHLAALTGEALNWLETRKLAYSDERVHYKLTALGRTTALSVLPSALAAGYARLLRDLLEGDCEDHILTNWKPLDHLICLNLLYDRTPSLRPFSEALAKFVDGWAERNAQFAPHIFQKWVRGGKGYSSAHEILGSLGVSVEGKSLDARKEAARKEAYKATFLAIVLHERSMGTSNDAIEKQYGIKNFEGIEEGWRDGLLWLLGGVSRMLDIKVFFYHLKETCEASPERIQRVKRLLGKMRHETFDMQEQIKYCSALGPLLKQLKRSAGGRAGVGIQSIRKLEEAGVTSFSELQKLGYEGLIARGIRRDIAKRIASFTRKRLM